MGISVVIITKNEEERIKKCLDSLRGFADEIVIVDDLSTDKTVEICKDYGAKVIIHESKGDFGSQRNIGIDNSKGEWILQMDADEVVPYETAKEIRKKLMDSGEFVAFELKRRNFLLSYPLKYGGSYNYGIKLFRKGKVCYNKGHIHETLKIEGKVGRIEADIYHYPFSSIRDILNKMNFYTDVEVDYFTKSLESISFKEIKYRLTWKSLKLFWKLYVKKKGYKDGMYGLVWCIINVIGPQIKWLKVWEKALKEEKIV